MSEPTADRDAHIARGPVAGPVMCEFRVPKRDWAAARLDRMAWEPNAVVLDAGCGPGAYVPGTRQRVGAAGTIVGLDLNLERVRAASTGAGVQGDAAALPFPDGSFDAVLAMHMLYHVPDIGAAIAEFRRVTRAGGTLLVSTSAGDDEPEVIELFLRSGGTDRTAFGDWRFCMENAEALLRKSWDTVSLHIEESTFEVPTVEPVVNSFDSQRYMLESRLEAGLIWEAFLDNVRIEADRTLAREGIFRVRCWTPIYVCR